MNHFKSLLASNLQPAQKTVLSEAKSISLLIKIPLSNYASKGALAVKTILVGSRPKGRCWGERFPPRMR